MAYATVLGTHLEIDSVPLSTPAWEHTNLYVLLGVAGVRGDNVVMPGAVGVRAVRRRPSEMTATVDLTVYGDVDWEGTPYGDAIAGLVANLEHLKANVADPLVTPLSVRTATIVYPTGTLSAGIQVLGFEVTDAIGPGAVAASMDITIIGGRFR